ncbi:CUB and sushi domain-containing protein 3-like [Strongylocentrotus purpuratus]|uniref:CUB domain-containing protein n=1 Tax=Strongylocentrotus purpuratus TaxID=7668 RepID=A0A7M7NSI7_STRPU|nr:CUB and sushi domain-containing protein 3-like [Strongylocentrotus purpuratus]
MGIMFIVFGFLAVSVLPYTSAENTDTSITVIEIEWNEPTVISSPGYPSSYYGSNLDLTWVLKAPESHILQIHILDLALETKYDYLYIGYGPGPNEPGSWQLQKLTGYSNSSEPATPGHSMWVRFTTDVSMGDIGFSLRVTPILNPGKIILAIGSAS